MNTLIENKHDWETYIKNPLRRTNGYITTYKALYKIIGIKICRHFSYIELAKVKRDGSLGPMTYLASIGSNWEDTNKRLATKIKNHLYDRDNNWVNWGEVSC